MPIRREQRSRYPENWLEIRRTILLRAAGGVIGAPSRCECTNAAIAGDQLGRDGRCTRVHGEPIPGNPGRKTVLTIAHVRDPSPENVEESNLQALCQRCHLRLDARLHAETAARTRRNRRAS